MDLQKQEHLQSFEFKTKTTNKDSESNDNPNSFLDGMQENQVKTVDKPQDLFVRKNEEPGMFEDILAEIKKTPEEIKKEKKEQRNFIKSLAHEEKKTFSLYNSLGGSPTNILKWLKGSAAVDGASKSFKAVIEAFETMMRSPAEVVTTASYQLQGMVENYLATHSKKPSNLYGRQRVTICNEILAHLSELPMQVTWERASVKRADLPDVQPKEEELKNHQKTDTPAGAELRSRELESMIKEVITLSESEVEKLVMSPAYFKENYQRFTTLSAIAKQLQNSDDSFDKEYIKKNYGDIATKLNSRFNLLINGIPQLVSVYLDKEGDSIDVSRLKEVLDEYNLQKEASYARLNEKNRYIWDGTGEMSNEEKVDQKIMGHFDRKGEKELKKTTEDIYKRVHVSIDKYFKDGSFSLPPESDIEEVLANGTLEDKFGLWMVMESINTSVNNQNLILSKEYEEKKKVNPNDNSIVEKHVGLSPKYAAYLELLQDSIIEVKKDKNEKSDFSGLSEDDAIQLGFIAASYNFVAKSKYTEDAYNKINQMEIKEGDTKEDIKNKKMDIIADSIQNADGILCEPSIGYLGNATKYELQERTLVYSNYFFIDNQAYMSEFNNMGKLRPVMLAAKERKEFLDMESQKSNKTVENVKAKGMLMESTENVSEQAVGEEKEKIKERIPSLMRDKSLYKTDIDKISREELSKEKEADKNKVKGLNTKFKSKYSKKENNEARKSAQSVITDSLSVNYTKESEKNMNFLVNYSKQKWDAMKKAYNNPNKAYNRDDEYYLAYLYPVSAEKPADPAEERRQLDWNERFVDIYTVIEAHKEGEPEHTQACYQLSAMMEQRLEDMLRFNVTKNNINDINWVNDNGGMLQTYGQMCVFLDNIRNMARVKHGNLNMIIWDNLQKNPKFELLIAKSDFFPKFSQALVPVFKLTGLKFTEFVTDTKDIIATTEDDEKVKQEEEQFMSTMQEMYTQAIESIQKEYDKYAKLRDKFLA